MIFNKKYNKLLEQYNNLQNKNNSSTNELHTLKYLLNMKDDILKIKCKHERKDRPYKQGKVYEAKLHPSGSLFSVKVHNGKELNIYVLNNDSLFKEYFEIVVD